MMQFQHILLPTDFSQHSATATACACELAGQLDAKLHLLHVLESHVTATPQFGMGVALPAKSQESKAAADSKLDAVLDPTWRADHRVVKAVTDGKPVEAIVHYAQQNNIDLIVMSTHGHSGLKHAFMGSVAESVLRKAPCPVLTVRPTAFRDVNS